jgi:hypothetical protein
MSSISRLPNIGLLYAKYSSSNNFINSPICSSIKLPNCKKSIFGNLCIECEENYYLTPDSSCESIGQDFKINFCEAYSSNKKCISCKKGYHLEGGQSRCEIDDFIPNCEEYQNQIPSDGNIPNKTSCRKCNPHYELSNENCIYKEIVNRIEGCIKYNYLESLCEECEGGLRLSDDQQMCTEYIQFCKIYYVQQISLNPGILLISCLMQRVKMFRVSQWIFVD